MNSVIRLECHGYSDSDDKNHKCPGSELTQALVQQTFSDAIFPTGNQFCTCISWVFFTSH